MIRFSLAESAGYPTYFRKIKSNENKKIATNVGIDPVRWHHPKETGRSAFDNSSSPLTFILTCTEGSFSGLTYFCSKQTRKLGNFRASLHRLCYGHRVRRI